MRPIVTNRSVLKLARAAQPLIPLGKTVTVGNISMSTAISQGRCTTFNPSNDMPHVQASVQTITNKMTFLSQIAATRSCKAIFGRGTFSISTPLYNNTQYFYSRFNARGVPHIQNFSKQLAADRGFG